MAEARPSDVFGDTADMWQQLMDSGRCSFPEYRYGYERQDWVPSLDWVQLPSWLTHRGGEQQ